MYFVLDKKIISKSFLVNDATHKPRPKPATCYIITNYLKKFPIANSIIFYKEFKSDREDLIED